MIQDSTFSYLHYFIFVQVNAITTKIKSQIQQEHFKINHTNLLYSNKCQHQNSHFWSQLVIINLKPYFIKIQIHHRVNTQFWDGNQFL